LVYVNEDIEYKNIQQQNKVRGTVFERYVVNVFRDIFPDAKIITQKDIKSFLKEDFGSSPYLSRYYAVWFSGWLEPMIFTVKSYKDGLIEQLYEWRKNQLEKGSYDFIIKYKFTHLEAIRLDELFKTPDIIIQHGEQIFIVDSKFRSSGKIYGGDIKRGLTYYKILKFVLFKQNIRVKEPILIFNFNPVKKGKRSVSERLEIIQKHIIDAIKGNLDIRDKRNVIKVINPLSFLWKNVESKIMLPKWIISERKKKGENFLKKLIEGKFYLSFIDWYLYVQGIDPEKESINIKNYEKNKYIAYSSTGFTYIGNLDTKKKKTKGEGFEKETSV